MDFQKFLVYLLVAGALLGAFRFFYKKWKIFHGNQLRKACGDCAFKKTCEQKNKEKKADSCSCR